MPKYRLTVETTATADIEIDVPDDVTDPNEISELAFSKAGLFPTLSAEASGWGEKWTLELGEWEDVLDENGEPTVVRIDGAAGE